MQGWTLLALLALGAQQPSAPPTGAAARRALDAHLDQAAAQGFNGVVLVARGGEVLVERGIGRMAPGDDRPVAPDAVMTVGSITKQFTAAAILALEEAGKLRVGDPISRYLPGVPADKGAVTVHHLLTHQAGFPGAIGDDRERIGRDEYVALALATPLVFAPGDGYRYSNVGYSLAAAIVERVSGQAYERYLRERLFEPAGMKDTGYHLPAWDPARLVHGVNDAGGDWGSVAGVMFGDGGPGWHLLGNGGIHSTARDMFSWHVALQGGRVLSATSRQKWVTRHVDEGGGTWYGYGWSLEPTPWGELVTHNGGNGIFFADYLRFPERDAVVFLATTSRDRRLHDLGRPLARILFTGEAPELEPAPGPLLEATTPDPRAATAAARWGLPATAAGERAGELLDAVRGTEVARRAAVASLFATEVVERRGVEGLVGLFARLAGDLGTFTVRGTRRQGEHGFAVVLDSESAGERAEVQLELELEPAPPHRIRSLGVQLGD